MPDGLLSWPGPIFLVKTASMAAPASTTVFHVPKQKSDAFVDQRNIPSRREGEKTRKKKKKILKKGGSPRQSPRRGDGPSAEGPAASDDVEVEDAEDLRAHILMRDLELAEIKSMLASEAERTEEMQSAAELALRALDAQLADGKWSTVVTPPDGTQPGHTFQWMDATKGINATAVTVPADWVGGPVLVRLHRTPVAPRLPAPSLGAPPPLRPLRNPFGDAAPLAGVADTRPVNFSEEWKSVFKAAGVRKQDLSDPVKAMRIALALAESWDVRAALPEMPGFTDKLGPLASLSLGPRGAVADGDADCHADGEAHAEELVVAPTEAAEPAEASTTPAAATAEAFAGGCAARTRATQSDHSAALRPASALRIGSRGASVVSSTSSASARSSGGAAACTSARTVATDTVPSAAPAPTTLLGAAPAPLPAPPPPPPPAPPPPPSSPWRPPPPLPPPNPRRPSPAGAPRARAPPTATTRRR